MNGEKIDRKEFEDETQAFNCWANGIDFSAEVFEDLLEQKGAVGIRIFPCLFENRPNFCLVACDDKNKPIMSTIYQRGKFPGE